MTPLELALACGFDGRVEASSPPSGASGAGVIRIVIRDTDNLAHARTEQTIARHLRSAARAKRCPVNAGRAGRSRARLPLGRGAFFSVHSIDEFVGVAGALAALKPQREGERNGEIVRRRGGQSIVGGGHPRRIGRPRSSPPSPGGRSTHAIDAASTRSRISLSSPDSFARTILVIERIVPNKFGDPPRSNRANRKRVRQSSKSDAELASNKAVTTTGAGSIHA